MRLDPSVRGLFSKLLKKGLTVTRIAELLDTTRQTVHKWLKRASHRGRESIRDRPRAPKGRRITKSVELSILAWNAFKWGKARIQQGLLRLTSFMCEAAGCVQNIRLSRESINNVLTRHSLNGYPTSYEKWRFSRAGEPDEL